MAIVDRVRKLVELSKHNNSPEEAARAAALAQELMFKYQIGEADLEVDGRREPEALVEEAIQDRDPGKKRDVWRACLAYAVAKGFGCQMYNDHGGKFQIYGLKSAVQTVSYVYGYLMLEVNRLCEEAWREHGREQRLSPRTWKNSFRMGAVNAIRIRLEAQRKAQATQVAEMVAEAREKPAEASAPRCTALALYKTDEERVSDGWKTRERELHLRSSRISGTRRNPNAYQRGRAAGEGVALGSTGRGLGASASKLSS